MECPPYFPFSGSQKNGIMGGSKKPKQTKKKDEMRKK